MNLFKTKFGPGFPQQPYATDSYIRAEDSIPYMGFSPENASLLIV